MHSTGLLHDHDSVEFCVRKNLVHFQNWSDVVLLDKYLPWHGRDIRLLSGFPPTKLRNDDVDPEDGLEKEFILPVSLAQYQKEIITIECIDQIFRNLCEPTSKRIVLAILNDDGTIVFYFLYKGIHKPKKN